MHDRRTNLTEAEERKHLERVTDRISLELSDLGRKVQTRYDETHWLKRHIAEEKANMDHAEKASMRQSADTMTSITDHSVAQQQRLRRLLESPYFGRIDVQHDGGDALPVYIGIHSFYDREEEKRLVYDWRAPISSMFYEYELGEAQYGRDEQKQCHIDLKRQYRIENQQLVFMIDTALNIQDDILQQELSRASDDKMKNIVATIQRDQNAIIRNDRAHTLVIQGAAGSGKTSIALHRIAFLLYRHKDTIRSEDILIISPNKVFAHYISQVLPELGEEMIQETTMEELARRQLGPKVKFQKFSEQVAVLLENRDSDYAQRVRFKATTEFLTSIDEYIEHVRSTNVQPQNIRVGWETLDGDWIVERFGAYRRFPIGEQITRVIEDILDYLGPSLSSRIVGKQRTQLRKDLKRLFTWTTLKELYENFYDWLGQPQMFKQIKGGKYEWADVFPLLHLSKLVDPIPATNRIKHVVIDEMQDYTPIQYRIINNLFPCRKTILGDHNQSVSPHSSSSAEMIGEVLHQAHPMYMHKSYRSTIEITCLAQTIQCNPDLIPIERRGDKPTIAACRNSEREVDRIRQAIAEFQESPHRSLGIICRTSKQAWGLYQQLVDECPGVRLLDDRSTEFSDGVMIATAYLAKGLEFDEVIVPFCSDKEYSTEIDRHMLYVGCTRAMHKLTLTHTGQPSLFLTAAAPGFTTMETC